MTAASRESELPLKNGSESSPKTDDDVVCPTCGFKAKSAFGLRAHQRKHDGEEPGEIDPSAIPIKKPATKASQKELKEVQEKLADNIKTVGQILHGVFYAGKLLKLQNPDARFRIPNTKIDVPIPDFDTHLPYTLISRSELTAELLVKYAESNETLLRWLVRFNSIWEGGQTGSLIGAHVVAAASSLGINPPMVGGIRNALIPDVLEQVQAENFQLRQQVAQMQAEMAAMNRDGRGAGN